MGYRGETMWSWRGSQCWTRLAALAVAFAWGIGSAAAVESNAPSLRVAGRASFSTEAHADIDTYEVGATLSDEVGHPLPAAEIRVRAASVDGPGTLRRCGDARGEASGELLASTDKSGHVCFTVTGLRSGTVELSYQDPRDYLERTSSVIRLPDSVATSFQLGFDPPLTTLSLDQPVQEVGLVARAEGGASLPDAAELLLALAADGSEREIARVPLDGLGEVRRLSIVSSSFGAPGPARLVARLRARDGEELARSTCPVLRTATVALHTSAGGTIKPGDVLQIRAASALGPASSGVVEASLHGRSVAAAPLRDGAATLALPTTPSALLTGTLKVEYVGGGAGWLAGPALELRVVPAGPSYAGSALWVALALVAASAVALGRRSPPRARPSLAPPLPRPRASVEVIEALGAGGGYRGFVKDAHDGGGISAAAVTFVGPSAERPVLMQVSTAADGSFEVTAAGFPGGTLIEVAARFHAPLSAPLPGPGVLELSLVGRRRALLDRLVRWAERRGKPWLRPHEEPTPAHVARVAAEESELHVQRWAQGLEHLAFGPMPPDAAAEQAAGVATDPKTSRERGID